MKGSLLPDTDNAYKCGSITTPLARWSQVATVLFYTNNIFYSISSGGFQVRSAAGAAVTFNTLFGGTSTAAQLNTVGAGNGEFNIFRTGELTFTHGGLPFGGISVVANTTETAIAVAGTKVQFTLFDTDDAEHNADADHANDHIVIEKAGEYKISCFIHADSVAGPGATFSFDLYINNGVTPLANIHAHRSFTGGGGQTASIALGGIATLAVNDTVELWVTNDTGTENIILRDVTLSLVQRGS